MCRSLLPRTLGLSALSLLLAVPDAPAEPPAPRQAQAEAVLARTRDLGRRLKTFSATVTRTGEMFDAKGQLTERRSSHSDVLLRRPAHWRYVFSTAGKTSTDLCDGEDHYTFSSDGTVRRYKLTARGTPPVWDRCLAPLLDPDRPLVKARQAPRLCYLGKLEHDRQSCDVIQVRGESRIEFQCLLFLDGRGVPVKWVETHFRKDGSRYAKTEEVTRYALDPELPPERFAFKLPEGAKLIDGDAQREKARADSKQRLAELKEALDEPLLKVGRKAPAFEVPDTDGNQVTLDGLLKGKKALVLHLWCFS